MNLKILITGGACAGKTEIIKDIKERYENKEYNIFILKEIPTFLITNKITAEKIGKEAFIKLVIKISLHLDKIYNEIAKKYDKCLIIYDGSAIDALKFISKKEFDEIINKYNTSYDEIVKKYNKIIFLETIAKKEPQLYTTRNNKARLTDINKAIERNDLLLQYYKDSCNYIEGNKNIKIKKQKVFDVIEKLILQKR